MATADSMPTAPKANRGNRRSGAVKGTHSGLRRGQLAWYKDPLILERINLIRTLKAQGYVASQMLPVVNQLMARRGAPEIIIDTVYDDFARLREIQQAERLRAGEVEREAREAHLESVALIKLEAWKAFHTTPDKSLNRSAYLNTLRACEELACKIDRTLSTSVAVDGKLGDAPVSFTIQIGGGEE